MSLSEIQGLIDAFAAQENIDAVALGGSRSSGANDSHSDYDLYIYTTEPLSLDTRRQIMTDHCSTTEIGNHYWEDEDNCILNTGTPIDVIYRNWEHFSHIMTYIVDEHHSMNGYTTCFWHNLLNSQILFDRNGNFAQLQKKYAIPYPAELKQAIIEQNMNLLTGVLPSYDLQIKKALERNDVVSVNHRVTGFLASYFDVIFALNEKTHPGEKRLIELCKAQCTLLPKNFEENINHLFNVMYHKPSETMSVIADMIAALKEIIC